MYICHSFLRPWGQTIPSNLHWLSKKTVLFQVLPPVTMIQLVILGLYLEPRLPSISSSFQLWPPTQWRGQHNTASADQSQLTSCKKMHHTSSRLHLPVRPLCSLNRSEAQLWDKAMHLVLSSFLVLSSTWRQWLSRLTASEPPCEPFPLFHYLTTFSQYTVPYLKLSLFK